MSVSTTNTAALAPQTLREMMADVKRRLHARTAADSLAAAERARERQAALGAAAPADGAPLSGDGAGAAAATTAATAAKRGPILPGQALRETDAQLHRVFQLFDPRNTKKVPLGEVLLLLRAVAIDIDDTILREVLAGAFSLPEQSSIAIAQALTFAQFLTIVKNVGTAAGGRQEARRVFEAVLPKGASALGADDFRAALRAAEARITDSELGEIFRYCSLSGNPKGMVLEDWQEIADFIGQVGL
jgi:Ca2+-binding EF-hand superfamily protein